MLKPNLSITIGDVTLNNPIITASGTFGFGREYGEYIDLNQLGGIAVKGLTLEPRLGNKTPRIAETPSGILNSVGLENPGVKAFIKNEIPFLTQYDSKIIANIAGSTVDDYLKMVEILNDTLVDLFEINLSCPNVREGCLAFGSSKDGVYRVTKAIKEIAKKPIIIKLTPNVTDITSIALGAQEGGADAISLINTITGMKIDIKTKKPVLHNNTGGLSGPCIRPIAVRMVHQVYQTVDIPIIGMGGITNLEDALEFFIAGASAVMIGTYHFMDPYVSEKVTIDLLKYLVDNNISDIKQLIGSLILHE
ncbi:MAG: dihydroorotate dehydrogenase [Clostridiales bacterium]|nr:dihydroorotate dehydrogenase [Clostridiales bacterium]